MKIAHKDVPQVPIYWDATTQMFLRWRHGEGTTWVDWPNKETKSGQIISYVDRPLYERLVLAYRSATQIEAQIRVQIEDRLAAELLKTKDTKKKTGRKRAEESTKRNTTDTTDTTGDNNTAIGDGAQAVG